jgi:hypothetical protein
MILKSESNWLFRVVFSVEITLSGSHSGNSFEFSHRLTCFLNYTLSYLKFLNLIALSNQISLIFLLFLIPHIIISIRANGPGFSGSHSGNSFEFSHRLTCFLNYTLFCLSFCLRLNIKPVNYFTMRRSSMAKRESGSVRPDTYYYVGY